MYRDFEQKFSAAAGRQDDLTAEREAHSLKGSAGNIGANEIRDASAKLEQACREKAEYSAVKLFLDDVINTLNQVIDGIDEFQYYDAMLITVLGSGTSCGVPLINCQCPVCTSEDPHDKRLRASVWVKINNTSIIIDTTTDFRQQALREKIDAIDGILFTHCHADHVHGLDDIRPYTFTNPVPVFGNELTMTELNSRFAYIFKSTQRGGGKPRISLNAINEGEKITIGDVEVLPIPLKHGELDVLGYRIGNFAYLTDCSRIPEDSFSKLSGVDYLIIDALRYKSHPTHFTIPQAIEAVYRIKAKKSWLTHLCHDNLHKDLKQDLPDGVYPAFDGLKIEI